MKVSDRYGILKTTVPIIENGKSTVLIHLRAGVARFWGYFSASLLSILEKQKAGIAAGLLFLWLRGLDLNQRPSGYEPDELPLLHPATCFIVLLLSLYCSKEKLIIENRKSTAAIHFSAFQPFSVFISRIPIFDSRPIIHQGLLVPGAGLEPAWTCAPWILSPLRLPFRHPGNRYKIKTTKRIIATQGASCQHSNRI